MLSDVKSLLLLLPAVSALAGCNLTVNIADDIGGSVHSEDGYINCPANQCTYNYPGMTASVTLVAEAVPGYLFGGFVDAEKHCINGVEDSLSSALCVVKSNAPKTVIARFDSIAGKMIPITGGSFNMGSDAGYSTEQPVHAVSVSDFYLAEYEVTWDQYLPCIRAGECPQNHSNGGDQSTGGDAGWGRGSQPMINVSWGEAQKYIGWLNAQTGEQYRLPSEAEWEYAARAGTTTTFYTGDCITIDQANINGTLQYLNCGELESVGRAVAVKSYPANPIGLFDMYGNVAELVQDCSNTNYEGAPNNGEPWLEGTCLRRIVRGGSWASKPRNSTSSSRGEVGIDMRSHYLGFRLARDME